MSLGSLPKRTRVAGRHLTQPVPYNTPYIISHPSQYIPSVTTNDHPAENVTIGSTNPFRPSFGGPSHSLGKARIQQLHKASAQRGLFTMARQIAVRVTISRSINTGFTKNESDSTDDSKKKKQHHPMRSTLDTFPQTFTMHSPM